MIRILNIIILALLLIPVTSYAQFDRTNSFSNSGSFNENESGARQDSLQDKNKDEKAEKSVPSYIEVWKLKNIGATIEKTKLDTALTYYHIYNPIEKISISNTYTGNQGGAYISNDYFKRKHGSDNFLYNSYYAYGLFPESINYLNTTTPYTLLDYCQSGNKNVRNETRLNIIHSQNVNPRFNFIFLYNTAKSTGFYQKQENKYHNIGLITSYVSDKFISHSNILFNQYKSEENGGMDSDIDLNEYKETETYIVNLTNANSKLKNTTVNFTNEYRVGKNETKKDSLGNTYNKFRPVMGFIWQMEYSGNKRIYSDDSPDLDFYPNSYIDSTSISDSIFFNRFTNIFQIKYYENLDRKYTFGKRVFIGYDGINIKMPSTDSYTIEEEKYNNLYVGGGISRLEGTFWKWNAQGKIYITGYKSKQTELNAWIEKPLKINKDTTTLRLSGNLNTFVPDYFISKYHSDFYQWNNDFNNSTQLLLHGNIHSQRFNFNIGANYTIWDNYIYLNSEAIPQQGSKKLMVFSGYINKDFIHPHWEIRMQALWQKSSQEDYLHLPDMCAFMSINYKTILSKVMDFHIGLDVRYNTLFYSDAYEPETGQYHWQNEQKTGNYPFVCGHLNFKLKRTRFFAQFLNTTSGLLDGNFWAAPNYPLYRRTFMLGVAWSFYD
ncbi:MAG: putative porin [Prolixibacteraceae bacterium]|nr:putative porin [Prolixibacteraceae bacterium]